MAIQGVTPEAYEQLFSNAGGEIIATLDRSDISSDGSFEESSLIGPYLYSGFEIKPNPPTSEPSIIANLCVYGDDWTQLIARTYLRGGKIVYRRVDDRQYEAKITVPAKTN